MMPGDSLHLQVKTIETQLSRAQSCLGRGDVHACQLHQLFAMSSFLSLMGATQSEQTGKLGRRGVSVTESAADVAGVRSYGNIDVTDADNQGKIRFAPIAQRIGDVSDGMRAAMLADDNGCVTVPGLDWRPDAEKSAPVPVATPQTPSVRQSLRWEHLSDDFGGKMCLFIGEFDIIGIQQDEDDNERAFYYPTTGWYHLENIIDHWPSSILNRDENLDQLMRTPEQAMRWTEEQLKLPILPTWLNGEQVKLAAHPEPQEPYWRESSQQPGFWILWIGRHQIGAVSMQHDDKWFVDGLRMAKPMTFEQARTIVEVAADLRPCRVIR